LSTQPLFVDASENFQQGRYNDALVSLNRLLDFSKDAQTYALLARTFAALGLQAEAAQTYTIAAEAGGPDAEDFYIEAMKLYCELGEDDKALSLGLPLLTRAQSDADLAFMIVNLFWKRGEKEIVRAFLPVLAGSENAKHNSLAFILLTGSPSDRADREALEKLALKMPKSLPIVLAHLVAQREVNAYTELERLQPMLDRLVAARSEKLLRVESPFYNLMWMEDEAINKQVGYVAGSVTAERSAQRRAEPHVWGEKIRIGYLSSDFWSIHATMKLLTAVLEAHDPARFDVTLYCYTDPKYLKDHFPREKWGRVVNIRDMTDAQAAQTIRQNGTDILVEMKGHTRGGRPAILNHSAAPIQVAWLGFPGTTVNTDIDYIVGDHSVLPNKSKPHYWEKFCRLPESYQPNNPGLFQPKAGMFTRAEATLPDDAFVFASFNASRKITIRTINLWARILHATPNSVIWIMVKDPVAEANIRNKFISAGIEGKRVIFTKMVPYEAHLARIMLADVGLDPFPCNGHTTTSEQLWAGLPVLTKKGANFSSRVTESLLRAIDLPEMITANETAYFRLAVKLYENPGLVKEYSKRLEKNRFEKPLFDSERYCRHLETAFEMMVERARNGLAPDHIDVPALPPRSGNFM
jgi:predicted O-linked N-acetylglucosamine transferase (SPINDLY family)